MAEFVKVIKEYKRLCDTFETCNDCPLYNLVRTTPSCVTGISNPEEAECIVMQWAKEHPVVTNRMKFREVFGMDLIVTKDNSKWLDEEYKEK